MNAVEHVVLVDENDQILGTEEKMKAHELALLHRAFSVFIYRKEAGTVEILLQQRYAKKYHCGGLWTNTCCSHPRLDEEITLAGRRRLKEEMSLDIPLRRVGSFVYKISFSNGLTEHELDHVLVGEYLPNQSIILDPLEAEAYRWATVENIIQELSINAEHYTPWFKPAFQLILEDLCLNC